jgi:predicted alpha/beta superfamily hydrolase
MVRIMNLKFKTRAIVGMSLGQVLQLHTLLDHKLQLLF